jgi:formate--tetrahydrofolate ligase
LALSDYVVTEAGFGADCGAEKFFNIKCRVGGFKPDAAVVVVSLRALKAHSGICKERNLSLLEKGLPNLEKQIENIKLFGIPVVVAINRFNSDTDREIDFLKRRALELGADDCQVSRLWQKGSKGGIDLAKSVIKSASQPKKFKFLYPLDMPIKEKIRIIAAKMYGAKEVEYSQGAETKIKLYTQAGWDKLAVCMAKTHLSLSDNPLLKGRPRGFILSVRDIRAYIGAGFLSCLCGKIQTMPGLPTHPRGENIDINLKGDIIGL